VFAPLSTRWVRRWGNKVVVAIGMAIVAISLLSMLTLTTTSSAAHVVVITMILGLGMANIMAPATESIMGSLPRAKAGVGSAMNDTTRQVGGAVGVALLGSILSSQYGANVSNALRGHVPDSLLAGARDSVGAAVGLSQKAAARPFAAQIVDAAHHSFVSGMHSAVLVAAGIVVIGAVGVLRFLPARARDVEPVPVGIGAVDVVPAMAGAELAVELEADHVLS
jgi:Na+/melibiose symporter-like transporter